MAGTTKKRRKRNLVEDAEGRLVIATNRRAHRDFDILDRVEAGLVLHGTEVKSLREGRAQIADAYAYINRGEAWVTGLHISHYEHSSRAANHGPNGNSFSTSRSGRVRSSSATSERHASLPGRSSGTSSPTAIR